jgi:hypothetical protein
MKTNEEISGMQFVSNSMDFNDETKRVNTEESLNKHFAEYFKIPLEAFTTIKNPIMPGWSTYVDEQYGMHIRAWHEHIWQMLEDLKKLTSEME